MLLREQVRDAVAAVTDPELPVVTIADLGVLETVDVDEASGRVRVDLVPTFLGCPALRLIEGDVRAAAAAVAGVRDVEVRFLAAPRWTPDRITAEGRAALAGDLGIAVREAGFVTCPVCGGTRVEERSPFGPTACRAIAFCPDCRNAVEVIRP